MAITITPSKTGMNVGLGDIAVILSEQNQVLAETAIAQQKLTSSFDNYLKLLAGEKMDELQDERRSKAETQTKGMSVQGVMGKMPSAGGMLDYLKGFAKRLLPVALGLLFGDDLIKAATGALKKYLGVEVSRDVEQMIMAAVGGSLLGFLFGGIKGGLFGLVLGAFTSEPVRKKISEALSKMLGKDIDDNDWEAWAGGIAGAFAVLWGPKLLAGAIGTFFKSEKGTKVKKSFGAKFAGRLAASAGILLVGDAIADEIGNAYGEQAGDIASNVSKAAAFGAMFGPKGILIATIGMLAIEGGKALVDYFRGKNEQMFKESIEKSDKVIDEYNKTGDVNVLKEGQEEIGRAQTEARRMIAIGEGSGLLPEAQQQFEKTTLALGTARGVDGQLQTEAKQNIALRGGLQSAMDYAFKSAMKKSGGSPTKGDFLMALMELQQAERSKAYHLQNQDLLRQLEGAGLDQSVERLMKRSETGLSQTARESMERYGARSTNAQPIIMDNSQTNAPTNVSNSSPIVLPSGGATDYNDNKSKFFISGL